MDIQPLKFGQTTERSNDLEAQNIPIAIGLKPQEELKQEVFEDLVRQDDEQLGGKLIVDTADDNVLVEVDEVDEEEFKDDMSVAEENQENIAMQATKEDSPQNLSKLIEEETHEEVKEAHSARQIKEKSCFEPSPMPLSPPSFMPDSIPQSVERS